MISIWLIMLDCHCQYLYTSIGDRHSKLWYVISLYTASNNVSGIHQAMELLWYTRQHFSFIDLFAVLSASSAIKWILNIQNTHQSNIPSLVIGRSIRLLTLGITKVIIYPPITRNTWSMSGDIWLCTEIKLVRSVDVVVSEIYIAHRKKC